MMIFKAVAVTVSLLFSSLTTSVAHTCEYPITDFLKAESEVIEVLSTLTEGDPRYAGLVAHIKTKTSDPDFIVDTYFFVESIEYRGIFGIIGVDKECTKFQKVFELGKHEETKAFFKLDRRATL